MSKKNLLHCAVILAAMSLISCNKANDTSFSSPPNQHAQKVNSNPLKINAITVMHAPCSKMIILNCIAMDEIIVKPTAIAALKHAIDLGNSGIADFFSSESSDEITDSLPVEYMTKLVSGDYNVAISYEDDGKMVLIAGETDHVTFENHEFGIEFSF